MKTTLITLALLAGAGTVVAQSDAAFRTAFPAQDPGAAVIAVVDGQVKLHAGYGLADLENRVAARPETAFRIGSITKQYTAVAILKLVEEGKIDLNKTVEDYFPGLLPYGASIPIHRLLDHTSGIPSYTNQGTFVAGMRGEWADPLDVVRLTSQLPAEFAPGDRWNYNNTGYVLLGALIEKASGMKYQVYMERVLFPLAGLQETWYGDESRLIPNRAQGYKPSENGYLNSDFIDMDYPHAAGALVSTVADLHRWNQALVEGKVISPASLRRAWTPTTLNDGSSTNYGYGWQISTFDGLTVIEHGGGINGFVTHALWVPDKKAYVAVLTNREGGDPDPSYLAFRLLGEVIGRPVDAPVVALPAAELNRYAGVYEVGGGAYRHIFVENGVLMSRRSGSSAFKLQPIGPDTFQYEGSLSRVTFLRGADGRVNAMEFDTRRAPATTHARTADAPPAAAAEFALPEGHFAKLAGSYQLAPNFVLRFWQDGDAYWTQATNQPPIRMKAVSETRFVIEQVGAQLDFRLGADGKADQVTLTQGGRAMPAPRVSD